MLDNFNPISVILRAMDTAHLEKQAIKAAIESDWGKAQKLNLAIIKQNPQDLSALNRLARTYAELGKIEQARKTYRKVLSLDRYNPIASKNLERLSGAGKTKKVSPKKKRPSASDIFLEEPGKTKVVKLVKLAAPSVLSGLDNADPVHLVSKKRNVGVTNEEGAYLGAIPDDLSRRLIHLMQGGNRYEAFVKAVEKGGLQIFIRETFRSPRFKNLPSFTPSGTPYSAYLDPETLYEEKPEVTPTGEEPEEKD